MAKTTDTQDLPLVEIVWKDHYTLPNGWKTVEQIEANHQPNIIHSVGAVLKEDKNLITLIHTISDSGNAMHGVSILKSCIVKRRKLYTK